MSCALVLAATAARADPPPGPARRPPRRVQLVYTRGPGAEGCPGEEALRAAAARRMGLDPFDPAAARRLEVTIARRDGELRVAMSLHDEDGGLVWEENSIHSPGGCGPLVSALGLSVAIRLDPEPEPPAPPCPACPPPPPAPPAKVAPEPPPPVVKEQAPAETTPPGPMVMLGGGPRLAFETQSPAPRGATGPPFAVAPGMALFAGVRWPSFSLGLETRLVLPGTADDQLPRMRPVSIAGLLVPCAHVRWFFGCGLFVAGVAAPVGPDAPSPVRAFGQVGAGVRAGAERHLLRRLVLRGHIDLTGALVHEHLDASPFNWNVPEVVSAVGVDLAVLFPSSSTRADDVVLTPSTSRKDP